MPYYIVKAAPDQDLYMEWSTIVDAPTFIGTREEILAYLERAAARARTPTPEEIAIIQELGINLADTPETQVQRADETGTSAIHHPLMSDCPAPPEGAWDDAGFIVGQRGWLPRARLPEFLGWYVRNRSKAYALLDPFDDTDTNTAP